MHASQCLLSLPVCLTMRLASYITLLNCKWELGYEEDPFLKKINKENRAMIVYSLSQYHVEIFQYYVYPCHILSRTKSTRGSIDPGNSHHATHSDSHPWPPCCSFGPGLFGLARGTHSV